jgi:hypothetical protein
MQEKFSTHKKKQRSRGGAENIKLYGVTSAMWGPALHVGRTIESGKLLSSFRLNVFLCLSHDLARPPRPLPPSLEVSFYPLIVTFIAQVAAYREN